MWLAEQKGLFSAPCRVEADKGRLDTRAVVARFESERQALALMDHPNTRAGSTPEGGPYFVKGGFRPPITGIATSTACR